MDKQQQREMKVRIPSDLHAWFKQQSTLNDRSLNNLVVYALKQFKQQKEM